MDGSVVPVRVVGTSNEQHDVEAVKGFDAFTVPYAGRRMYGLVKRLVDVAGALVLMTILAPMVLIALAAIWIDSGLPVIYSQQRVKGRRVRASQGGHYLELETFTFYKLRTMDNGVAPDVHRAYMKAYIAGDEDGITRLRPDEDSVSTYKMLGDPRVTRIGAVLRTLSVDEIPQLWNVLKGDMSLVGPRPAIPYEVELYRRKDFGRFATKPGLTGLWQVSGRSETSFEEMIELDREYIDRQSILLDLVVLFRTIPAVVTRRGAG